MNRKNSRKTKDALIQDLLFVGIGIIITIILVNVGVIDTLLSSSRNYLAISSFVAGLLFTSTFTIAPASVAIVEIAKHAPLPSLALWGALGAMCGDLILFFFIRDRFAKDITNMVKPATVRHIMHSFHFGFLKWLSPLLGAFIIASPLPDEFGLTLLGISKVRVSVLMPIAFAMNFLGIYILVGSINFLANLFS